ncbi:unnamed protein product [Diamesa tonsa]
MSMIIQNVLKKTTTLTSLRSLSSGILNKNNGFETKNTNSSNKMHLAVQREYPRAAPLPIPPNIDSTEVSRFSPMRNREINGSVIDVTLDDSTMVSETKLEPTFQDAHLEHYDQSSVVNLSVVMQTNVPEPLGGMNKFCHLNMPGGSWPQQTKYLSHELQSAHYTNLRQEVRQDWSSYDASHQNKEKSTQPPPEKETNKSKLKKAVKEYGSTVIVFHVGISLMSLGLCYGLVSSGLDVMAIIDKIGLTDKLPAVAGNASTFVLSYAIHKVFAPVRISITLFSTPFIVKYLRSKGFLKK